MKDKNAYLNSENLVQKEMQTLLLWMLCSQILWFIILFISSLFRFKVQVPWFSRARITIWILSWVPMPSKCAQHTKNSANRFVTANRGFLWFQFGLLRIFLLIKIYIDGFAWSSKTVYKLVLSMYYSVCHIFHIAFFFSPHPLNLSFQILAFKYCKLCHWGYTGTPGRTTSYWLSKIHDHNLRQ